MKEQTKSFLAGWALACLIFFGVGAATYKTIVGTGSPSDNSIVVWDGAGGNRIKNTLLSISAAGVLGNGTWYIDTNGNATFISASYSNVNVQTLVATNISGNASGLTNIPATQLNGTIPTNNLPAYVLDKQTAITSTTDLGLRVLTYQGAIFNSLPITPYSEASNIVIDCNFNDQSYVVTNEVNFIHATNKPSATTNISFITILLTGDTINRNLTFPAAWKRLGTNISVIPSNKTALVSLRIGSTESDITYAVGKEE